jgi:hypothetical protein
MASIRANRWRSRAESLTLSCVLMVVPSPSNVLKRSHRPEARRCKRDSQTGPP